MTTDPLSTFHEWLFDATKRGQAAHDGLWWAWGQGTKAVKETQASLFG